MAFARGAVQMTNFSKSTAKLHDHQGVADHKFLESNAKINDTQGAADHKILESNAKINDTQDDHIALLQPTSSSRKPSATSLHPRSLSADEFNFNAPPPLPFKRGDPQPKVILPTGADIWNTSDWAAVTILHPAGVISHMGKAPQWADVPYLSLGTMSKLAWITYPVIMLCLIYTAAAILGVCLQTDPDVQVERSQHLVPSVRPNQLLGVSRVWYERWVVFCRCIPALLVFGSTGLVVAGTRWFPQETFLLVLTISSVMMFTMSSYMVSFMPFYLSEVRQNMAADPSHELDPNGEGAPDVEQWVILPNYKEEIDILANSIQSIAQSTIAKTIGVVLAMEQREEGAKAKVQLLRQRFAGVFLDIMETHHPSDLPNDPPGKASNTAWAFQELQTRLEERNTDIAKVVLSVADADSEFDKTYFEKVARDFVVCGDMKHLTLWQSPVLHLKNYHRQPSPVLVGSLFTCMLEGATLADPNAIRFPYSTYSLSMTLAITVGGWDPEWIAEDWHMGIKCYLLTLGRTQVRSIMAPTINYSPEDDTWFGTIGARWEQAKRHALGFSDMAYIFMMLPLIAQYLGWHGTKERNLKDFWRLFFQVNMYVIRLVNTHVVLATITAYSIFLFFLKLLLKNKLALSLDLTHLFSVSQRGCYIFSFMGMVLMLIVTIIFQMVYSEVKHRLEPATGIWKTVFGNKFLHWFYQVFCVATAGVFYFSVMGMASWIAAIKCMVSRHFVYVVAAKPSAAKLAESA
eukprot:CAMPEP_0194499040 /NCGR_PEP_ID=MMETSP0253-20130528/15477_1 /TAXON_ID=2966 /ORGANISM="Noctiluca scintillans" /LENGTH=744 /DNA_ID=CAMNT_0039340755 /DNA_START=69 /DNA_END=2303 /DNA_ORIENTATION=+